MRALLILLASLSAAQAASPCDGPATRHDELTEALTKQYTEVLVADAVMGGDKIELYVAPVTRTFTVIFTNAMTDMSCIIAAGTDFATERIPPDDRGEKV